jgi:hypothetical protein
MLKKLTPELIDNLIYELEELKAIPHFAQFDYSDLGNTIGATIGGVDITDNDKIIFTHGVKHGFSIADGSHYAPLSPEQQKHVDELNSMLKDEIS